MFYYKIYNYEPDLYSFDDCFDINSFVEDS